MGSEPDPETPQQIGWDDCFRAIDRVVATMPEVERTCATCRHANVPPMPADPSKGWIATCEAPIPVNVLWINRPAKLEFAAADAARWEGKRLRPCPAHLDKEDGHG